jgi:flagellar motor switch protein FliN
VNTEGALLHLAEATSEAVRGVLSTLAPEAVIQRDTRVDGDVSRSLDGLAVPAVATSIAFVDGVEGGNLLVMPVVAARRLAAAMMGMDPNEIEAGGELSELEFSAVGEAMNQMMSAAAMATSKVLDEEVEIAPPDVRHLADAAAGGAGWEHPGHATAVTFTFCGAPCLLVQLIPNAFIVRMTRALDEMTESHDDAPLGDALRDISVRVWAELGRTRMASGRVVALPAGAVVELDRQVEAPIDLYADGMRFATGRLLVTDDGGLAVRIEQVLGARPSPTPRAPPPTEVAV